MVSPTLFSSKDTDWETPQDLFDRLNWRFQFTLDVCASAKNTKCPSYFCKDDDGLARVWQGNRCWMNPPYGREISAWMFKARDEHLRGNCLIVALVPVRTDTNWWRMSVSNRQRVFVEFLTGRLRFSGAKNAAPFPSALIYYL